MASRLPWYGVLMVGCAAGSPPAPPPGASALPETANTSQTDENPDREARQVVLQAEADRRAAAFRERLARLRAEEEARALARSKALQRTRSPTTAVARLLAASGGPDLPPPKLDPRPDSREEGASPPPSAGPRGTSPGAPPAEVRAGPSPAEYLAGAHCLVGAEVRGTQAAMAEARRAQKPRRIQADWALALVELQGLADDIRGTLAHRGLANRGQSCAAPTPTEGLLWSLYGRSAEEGAAPSQVLRGAERLRSELEVRAGLPPREYER